MSPQFDELLSQLGARASGTEGQYTARCPAHDDKTPSLSISKPNGKVLLHCHAGCSQDDVIDALKARGLWEQATSDSSSRREIVRYNYTDEVGGLLFQVVRYLPKDFRQRRPDGAGGWIWNLKDVERVPYNLPAVRKAIEAGEPVYICEGEKDVESLRQIGLTATTNCGGAGNWRATDALWLKDAHVILLPDNDEPGRSHAAKVQRTLRGIAASVKVVNLPGLPEKGDVTDYLLANTRDELLAVVAKAGSGEALPTIWPEPIDLRDLALLEPEPPQMIMEGIPCGYATLIAGHGGAGKSAIALYLAVCIGLGLPFFGLPVERRRVLFLSCEDRVKTLHWRLRRICDHLGAEMAELHGWLDVLDLVGYEAILWERDPKTGYTATAAYSALAERIKQSSTQFLIVDGITDTYGGAEFQRTEVKRYVNALVGLMPEDGATLLIGHVDKLTAKVGDSTEGYSGTTGWHNAVRARWYLREDRAQDEDTGRGRKTGELFLELQKANLGAAGLELRFTWDPVALVYVGQTTQGLTHFDRKQKDRDELAAIRLAFKGCKDAGLHVPAAMTGQRTSYLVLSQRPEFPDTLRGNGREKTRRFWRHVEVLRQMRHLEEVSIERKNRHHTVTLTLTTEGCAACA